MQAKGHGVPSEITLVIGASKMSWETVKDSTKIGSMPYPYSYVTIKLEYKDKAREIPDKEAFLRDLEGILQTVGLDSVVEGLNAGLKAAANMKVRSIFNSKEKQRALAAADMQEHNPAKFKKAVTEPSNLFKILDEHFNANTERCVQRGLKEVS